MNLRHGDVHEVVSFYSFLQVPVDAVRVCTGPVCDCAGSRAAAHGRRDRSAVPRPLRPRAGRAARRRRRRRRHPLDERLPARARRRPRAAEPDPGRGGRASRSLRPDGDGRRRIPHLAQVGRRPARAGSARRDRQRRRGRTGHDQGPLRDGAPPAAPARRARGGDALLRDRRGLHLPARGVRHVASRAAGGDRRARASRRARRSAPARTSAARRPRCWSRWKGGAGCRGSGRRSRPSSATSAGRR